MSDEPTVPLAPCWALLARQPAIAERFARQRLAQAPDDGEAHKLLAAALTRQGRMDEALAAARAAVAALPQDAAAQFGLANALSGGGRTDDALAVVATARALAPQWAVPYDLEARIHGFRGEHERMRAAAARGLELDASDPDLFALHAKAAFALGDRVQAERSLRCGLELAPEHAELHRVHGEALLRRGEVRAASAALLASLRTEPESAASQRLLDEALRAHNVVYRWIARGRDLLLRPLRRLSPRSATIVLIGLFLVLRGAFLLVLIWPLLGDMLLWLHPVSRRVLSRGHRLAAAIAWSVVAGGGVFGGIALANGAAFADVAKGLAVVVFLMLVVGSQVRTAAQWRRIGILVAIGAALIAVVAFAARCDGGRV